MYIPPAFNMDNKNVIDKFINDYPFATLISKDTHHISHLPLILTKDGNLEGHFAINNPHHESIEKLEKVTAIFHGEHGYITPNFYETPLKAVPTWNYAVVHIHGIIKPMDKDELLNHVTELVEKFESDYDTPWSVNNVSSEFINNLLGAIKGFRIEIDSVEAKFKLGQNRSNADREGMIEGLSKSQKSSDKQLAELMRKLKV